MASSSSDRLPPGLCTRSSSRRRLLGAALLAWCGCSDSEQNRVEPDNAPPTVTLVFPLTEAATDGVEIAVRGSASDQSGVSWVTVNGVDATPDPDLSFQRWTATVPLEVGNNELRVEAEDTVGHRSSESAMGVVTRFDVLLRSPFGIAAYPASDRLFLADRDLDAIIEIDRTSGAAQVLSPSTGLPAELCDVAYDPNGDRLLAVDGLGSILAIDVTNGDRVIVADQNTGTGPGLLQPRGAAFDEGSDLLYVTDAGAVAVVQLDVTTGDRLVLSDAAHGSGPDFEEPVGIDLDPGAPRALVVDAGLRAVLAVDLGTGDRTIVSDDGHGAGPVLSLPPGIVVDPTSTQAYVSDESLGAVMSIDLGSGDRTVIADQQIGSGPTLPRAHALFLEGPDQLLVADAASGAVLELQASTGARTALSQVSLGTGPTMAIPAALIPRDEDLIALDEGLPAVLRIAGASGDRTVESSLSVGNGPFGQPRDLEAVYCGATDDYFVIDSELAAVLRIDYLTGNRAVLSDAGTGTGPTFEEPVALDLDIDLAENHLFVADHSLNALFGVDWQTGDRQIISDAVTGSGPPLDQPVDLAYDADACLVLLVNGTGEILVIDPTTGDRQLLSTCAQEPNEIVVESSTIFVADRDGVHEVLADGSCVPLATATAGSGPAVLGAAGLAFNALDDSLFALSRSLNAVLMIDRVTGQRAIVSK